jgi:hypothetical protein
MAWRSTLPVFVMNLFLLFPAVSSGLTEDQKLIHGMALNFASICYEFISSLSCSQFRSDRGPEADPGHGAQLCPERDVSTHGQMGPGRDLSDRGGIRELAFFHILGRVES